VDPVNGRPLDLRIGSRDIRVMLEPAREGLQINIEGRIIPLQEEGVLEDGWVLRIGNQRIPVRALRQGDTVWIQVRGRIYPVTRRSSDHTSGENRQGDPLIRAPMTGKVIRVPVKPGDRVQAGAVLVTVEAMKMEYHLEAPFDAVVEDVHAREGDLVDQDQVLVRLHPVEAS
jgi:3-methylcrotonyl-CoA carboxylase alpha subunit